MAGLGPARVKTSGDCGRGGFRPGRNWLRILELGGFGGMAMHRFIDGEDRMQQALLHHSLEDYASEENPVRVIEMFIGELDLAAFGVCRDDAGGDGTAGLPSLDAVE